jgi:hypothetical protein
VASYISVKMNRILQRNGTTPDTGKKLSIGTLRIFIAGAAGILTFCILGLISPRSVQPLPPIDTNAAPTFNLFMYVSYVLNAESYCYEGPKPEEFGDAGLNWERIGWRIRVRFKSLSNLVRPKDHIEPDSQ